MCEVFFQHSLMTQEAVGFPFVDFSPFALSLRVIASGGQQQGAALATLQLGWWFAGTFCPGLASAASCLRAPGPNPPTHTPPTHAGFPQFCSQGEKLMTASSQVVLGLVAKTQRETASVKVHSLDERRERSFQSVLPSLSTEPRAVSSR